MLKGDNVILRAFERSDLQRIHELEQNVDLVLLADGDWKPRSLVNMEKDFEERLNAQDLTWFALEVGGKLIGDLGLHSQNRRDRISKLGIEILDPAYLGKGYGRDALNVLLRYAFHIQNFRRVWLDVWSVNERAIRSYGACGFQEEGRLRQHIFWQGVYIDVIIMGLLRNEWEALQKVKAEGPKLS